ncbi:MAG: hypothetical protein AABX51_01965, partial [Nanoarchaeota archaeon]
MGRFGGLVLLFVLLAAHSVHAQSFTPWDAYLTDIKPEVKLGEDARVEFTILNNEEQGDTFRFFIDTLQFSVSSETPSDYLSGMVIPA